MDVMEGFRQRLLEARNRTGLSQPAVARRIGELVETTGEPRGQTIYEWEKGRRTPNPDQLLKLREVYDISLDWLIAGEGPMRADPGTDAIRLEVIGLVYNEEIDAEVLRRFARAAQWDADEDPADREAEIVEAAKEVFGTLRERAQRARSGDNGQTEDPATDDGNASPGTNRRSGP